MATLVEHAPALHSRTSTPPPHLTLNTSTRGTPAAIPNKHLPICSPGRGPTSGLTTPPASPPSKSASLSISTSILYPPENFTKLSESPPIYSIGASTLVDAIEHHATQPLPDPKHVFPWLHGLHVDNAIQLAFFVARKKALRKVPQCLRGVTIVKAGGDLCKAKLKGAISAVELFGPEPKKKSLCDAAFLEIDPKEGFSVRNFQIQACKMATVSDIVVYNDGSTKPDEVLFLAGRIATAQIAWREKLRGLGWESGLFNTFVVSDSFKTIEDQFPEIVAVDSSGMMTGSIVDFFYSERVEMASMTRASEIAPNVYLGPTPDPIVIQQYPSDPQFDVFIEASDLSQSPDSQTLQGLRSALDSPDLPTVHFEVPGSGSIMPPTWSQTEVDGLLRVCRWIWEVSQGQEANSTYSKSTATPSPEKSTPPVNVDGDTDMLSTSPNISRPPPRKILIHCADGYTESTLIGLTYYMYAHCLPVGEAWIKLHREERRKFFAYSTDVALLTSIQARILTESPARTHDPVCPLQSVVSSDPEWMNKMDGSLPSRILPYMYLGNLSHANNPALLEKLGIKRVVSVGEKVNWAGVMGSADGFELVTVKNVQDNGVDGLSSEFERCLEVIERGKHDGIATLVHCRVGVSRSATICIAEVMKELKLSFPKAYCYVRARRLNVIIQPHLRFTYELLKWEEELHVRRGEPLRRELEWATVAQEIALMNRPYSRG